MNAESYVKYLKQRLSHAGICMVCLDGPPEPCGCSDCLNTGWAQGDPYEIIARLDAEQTAYDARIKELEETNDARFNCMKTMTALIRVLEDTVKDLSNQVREAEEYGDELNAEIKTLSVANADIKAECENLVAENSTLRSENQSLCDLNDVLGDQNRQMRDAIEELTAENSGLSHQVWELEMRVSESDD